MKNNGWLSEEIILQRGIKQDCLIFLVIIATKSNA